MPFAIVVACDCGSSSSGGDAEMANATDGARAGDGAALVDGISDNVGSIGQADEGRADAGGGGSSGSDALAGGSDAGGGGDAGALSGTCNPDPLHTGLTAQQTGIGVDAFDCPILKWSATYGEPDPMIFKAIIYVESRFDATSVACPNLPCGTPTGWTAGESGCFGLMQIVPACGGATNAPVLQANGHPDLQKDAAAGDWPGSVFNPDANIHVGIAGIADNRSQVQKQFPGCTADQYTMMAIGNYNSYGSTKSCTVYNTSYDDLVLQAYRQYASAAGYPAHAY